MWQDEWNEKKSVRRSFSYLYTIVMNQNATIVCILGNGDLTYVRSYLMTARSCFLCLRTAETPGHFALWLCLGIQNLQTIQKQQAAKHCKCTIVDVENMLAKFTWAKEAQMKLEKMKEEGKPLPKSMAEVQKLMGSSPLDVARSNMAKSGQTSRNAFCPCGSKKRYKRFLNFSYC
ncbi:uncharacterized protein LOC125816269 [Solanum verrucosum]|uniref:uncharacterized protein LOC125816269 n=1 Tax=Solanum verrucosum TaxID=315347 RepID=UPI0020D14C85|nr:uncharacterized protein LOC125816269 [Solanum verrucosum]